MGGWILQSSPFHIQAKSVFSPPWKLSHTLPWPLTSQKLFFMDYLVTQVNMASLFGESHLSSSEWHIRYGDQIFNFRADLTRAQRHFEGALVQIIVNFDALSLGPTFFGANASILKLVFITQRFISGTGRTFAYHSGGPGSILGRSPFTLLQRGDKFGALRCFAVDACSWREAKKVGVCSPLQLKESASQNLTVRSAYPKVQPDQHLTSVADPDLVRDWSDLDLFLPNPVPTYIIFILSWDTLSKSHKFS